MNLLRNLIYVYYQNTPAFDSQNISKENRLFSSKIYLNLKNSNCQGPPGVAGPPGVVDYDQINSQLQAELDDIKRKFTRKP